MGRTWDEKEGRREKGDKKIDVEKGEEREKNRETRWGEWREKGRGRGEEEGKDGTVLAKILESR